MRTVLDQNRIAERRRASIAATFVMATALALPLAACDDQPAQPPQPPTEMTVQQDGRTSRLVQGREQCIAGLIEYGRTPTEAGEICDKAFADAMARRASNEQSGASHSTGGGGGGGGNNALLWYMIGQNSGRNSVAVYEGSRDSGMRFMGGHGYTSPPPASIPPRSMTPVAPSVRATTPPSASASVSRPAAAPSAVVRGGFAPSGVGGHGG